MDIEYLRKNNLILLECISGSKAYGLDTPSSDTDIKGVFLLPKHEYYGLNYTKQVSNESNDIVFYEFNRFMELLYLNNPNILELLNSPKEAVIYKHEYLSEINSELILSKLCKNTFGRFAISQIKKARGLNKKIVNPMEKERKGILSFCYVNFDQGSIPLLQFLKRNNWSQEHCGLVNVPNMQNVFGLFHGKDLGFAGIAKKPDSNTVSLSSIPKGSKMASLLYFNKDGYSAYCKEYKSYWDWVKNRNEVRYKSTESHGKNYDAKNMMHTFRLLEMAIEIAAQNKVNVKRQNRDFLLGIKSGQHEYDDLMIMADERQRQMEDAFKSSKLQESPSFDLINEMTFKIRNKFYTQERFQ